MRVVLFLSFFSFAFNVIKTSLRKSTDIKPKNMDSKAINMYMIISLIAAAP